MPRWFEQTHSLHIQQKCPERAHSMYSHQDFFDSSAKFSANPRTFNESACVKTPSGAKIPAGKFKLIFWYRESGIFLFPEVYHRHKVPSSTKINRIILITGSIRDLRSKHVRKQINNLFGFRVLDPDRIVWIRPHPSNPMNIGWQISISEVFKFNRLIMSQKFAFIRREFLDTFSDMLYHVQTWTICRTLCAKARKSTLLGFMSTINELAKFINQPAQQTLSDLLLDKIDTSQLHNWIQFRVDRVEIDTILSNINALN